MGLDDKILGSLGPGRSCKPWERQEVTTPCSIIHVKTLVEGAGVGQDHGVSGRAGT